MPSVKITSDYVANASEKVSKACLWLKNLRYLAKISLRDASEELRIDHSQLSKIERRKGSPQLLSILACVELYGVRDSDFFYAIEAKWESRGFVETQLQDFADTQLQDYGIESPLVDMWPSLPESLRTEITTALWLCRKYEHLHPSRFLKMKLRRLKGES